MGEQEVGTCKKATIWWHIIGTLVLATVATLSVEQGVLLFAVRGEPPTEIDDPARFWLSVGFYYSLCALNVGSLFYCLVKKIWNTQQ